MHSLLEVPIYLLLLFTLYFFLCIVFGAPIILELYSNLILSVTLTAVTGIPLGLVFKSENQIRELILEGRWATLGELRAHRILIFTAFGAWLGAIVIPLDWDRWWQRYPLPNLVGAICGSLFGLLLAEVNWFLRRRREKLP